MKQPNSIPRPVAAWVILCAYLNCAGWLLSEFHQLNLGGYLAVFLVGAVLSIGYLWSNHRWIFPVPLQPRSGASDWADYGFTGKIINWRRFRRPFPLAYLGLSFLVILGALIHAPSNYDALSYRVPRMLHWWSAEQWHWVHTDFARLNVRACGVEWLSLPIIIFTHTDRFLFLINVAVFFMMPGLFFSVFTRLGVRRRVAWYWMWLLPSGYCYLLQAGSMGNDLMGVLFGMAALDFALRARQTRRVTEVWLAILAAALLSGAKTSNLALLLPCGLAILPVLPVLRKHLVTTAGVGVVAVASSLLPVMYHNWEYCGDWTGLKAEHVTQLNSGEPVLRITHNAGLILSQNLSPPIFPQAQKWNNFMKGWGSAEHRKKLATYFEGGGAWLQLTELQMEEDAGVGIGVCLLLVAGLLARLRSAGKPGAMSGPGGYVAIVRWSGYGSILVIMAKAGLSAIGRLITPYYAFLVVPLLTGNAAERLVRNKWWQRCALLVFLAAVPVIVIQPARPLWPAQTILGRIKHPSPMLARVKRVYAVYGGRTDAFAPLRAELPDEAKVVGFIGFDVPEASLWRPFGSRRIEHVNGADSTRSLQDRGIKYILVGSWDFHLIFDIPLDEWLRRINAERVKTVPLDLRAGSDTMDWYIIRLKQ